MLRGLKTEPGARQFGVVPSLGSRSFGYAVLHSFVWQPGGSVHPAAHAPSQRDPVFCGWQAQQSGAKFKC